MRRNQQAFNPIDQIFKQKLVEHSSAYSAKVWENIQAELISPPNKNTKPAWIFWILGALLLGTSLAIFVPRGSENNSNSPLPSSSGLIIAQHDETDENIYIENNRDLAENYHSETDKADENADVTSLSESRKIITSDTNNFEDSNTATSNIRQQLVNEAKKSFVELSNEQKQESKSSNSVLSIQKMEHLDPLPSSTGMISLASISSVLLPTLFAKKVDPSDCPDFSRRKKGEMSVDVYYSSDIPLRTLTPLNSEFDAYALVRDETEKELYSFSAGVRAAYHISPSIALRAGIHYSQVNERFNFEDPNSQQVQTIITIDSSFVNGMWQITRDTQRVNLTGISEIQHYNRYRMLDIPVLLSYEYVGNQFDLAVNGGIMLNLLFKQKGRFLDANLMPTSFDSGDPTQFNAFKTNLGLSLYGSFTFAYKLNSQWSILIEPNVRHYINQVTLNSYPLKQSYTTVGVATGVRYHF